MILVDLKNNDAADISYTAITCHRANTYYTADAATPETLKSIHVIFEYKLLSHSGLQTAKFASSPRWALMASKSFLLGQVTQTD